MRLTCRAGLPEEAKSSLKIGLTAWRSSGRSHKRISRGALRGLVQRHDRSLNSMRAWEAENFEEGVQASDLLLRPVALRQTAVHARLERIPAKWSPVRRKNARQNEDRETPARCHQVGYGSGCAPENAVDQCSVMSWARLEASSSFRNGLFSRARSGSRPSRSA